MKMYAVCDHETWTVIDEFYTLEGAEKCVKFFEDCDKAEGICEKDFYEIREVEK